MPRRDKNIKGVSYRHAEAIAEVAKALNCFIFIRPSTDDTVRLIEAGFATKSNDVHDKSSDWGPMAGFVPIDQGLNKKNNSPSADKAGLASGYHQHGIEAQVHLKITPSLAASQPMYKSAEPLQVTGSPGHYVASSGGKGAVQPFDFYRATKHRDPVFARHSSSGEIYWVGKGGALVPVYVWGYNGVAITGDYDLWMVAPHISNADKQGLSSLVNIYTTVDEHTTPSAATPFILRLNNRLNTACRRAIPGSKQVFNHGAEAQNNGFTQALDDKMAMITPNGGFRNIAWTDLADAVNEMEHRGYLVVRNKKWTVSNPTLSGEKNTDGHYMWRLLAAKLRGDKMGAAVAKIALERKRGKAWDGDKGEFTWSADKEKGYNARLGERSRLSEFGRSLEAKRATGAADTFMALESDDFPKTTREPISDAELATVRGNADDSTARVSGAGANTYGHIKMDLTAVGRSINSSNRPFSALERDGAARERHVARIRAARGLG